jgi:hypothetical protein
VAGGDEVHFGDLTFHYRTDDGFKVITWSNHDLLYALVSSVSAQHENPAWSVIKTWLIIILSDQAHKSRIHKGQPEGQLRDDPIAALDVKLSDEGIAKLEAPYFSAPVVRLMEGTRFVGPVKN